MIVKIISYGLAVTVGFILAYLIFAGPSEKQPAMVEQTKIIDSKPLKKTGNQENLLEQIAANSQDKAAEIDQLRTLVKNQATRINELELELKDKIAEIDAKPENPSKLETITMDDFEDRIKGSLKNRFRGVAIELKEDQVAEFNKMFNNSSTKSEWGVEFENQIASFITNGDPNGLHFVEEVNCINQMCRLKVQSNESQSWQELYSSMTKENWFNSMTLVEKSEIPGMHIYYIPKPQDM